MYKAAAVVAPPRRQASRFVRKYGPWAIVTGASDGIGRAMAADLARRGLNVVLVARRQGALRDVAQELTAAHKTETRVFAVDLGDADGVRQLIDACGDLQVGLVAAVAGFGTTGDFTRIESANELNMVDVNCRSVVELTHHYARAFCNQRRGGIIFMSSLLAFQGVPRSATYAATKAFIQSFAEGLRRELQPRGIDVVASAPGPVYSGFLERANMRTGMGVSSETVARQTIDGLGCRGVVRPGFVSKFLKFSLMPLPRFGRVRIMGIVMDGMTRHQAEATWTSQSGKTT